MFFFHDQNLIHVMNLMNKTIKTTQIVFFTNGLLYQGITTLHQFLILVWYFRKSAPTTSAKPPTFAIGKHSTLKWKTFIFKYFC